MWETKQVTPETKHESPSSETIREAKGLSLFLASIFIAAQMAGTGVLALPKAVANAGWAGIALIVICCINSLYAGICLGKCWSILEERYDEYKKRHRYPYSAIAQVAVGKKMRYVVSFCTGFTLLGVATVFLLLISQLMSSMASDWGISFCYWVLIFAIILWPLTWLGTPKDFWQVAVIALVTTCVACLLLLVSLIIADNQPPNVEYPPPNVMNFFLSFGTIFFSFGGASSFPTFQNDMKNRNEFTPAITIAFAILLLVYLPIAILGYVQYGGGVDENDKPYLHYNILDSLPYTNLTMAIEILLGMHLFFAFLLIINTPAQEMEEFFKIPRKFGFKRCLLRSGILLLIVFVAQSIPRFGKILNFVGGSTITLTNSIFPSYFYLSLCSQSSENPDWPQRIISLPEKIYLFFVMIWSIIGGCLATYSAVTQIVEPKSFNPPCYVNMTAANP